VSLLAVVGGCYMLYDNGVDGDMSFSQLVATTRNPTLDRECSGAGLGGEYISERFLQLRLRFGILRDYGEGMQAGTTKVSFGSEHEVTPL
jgi:hypothetical protein